MTTLAERLNRLFAVVYPPGRGPYIGVEFVDLVRARGVSFSEAYLCQLRSGVRARPSLKIAEAIAGVFGVEAAYLLGDDPEYCAKLDDELYWLELARDETVRNVTSPILDLPANARGEVIDFIDRLKHAQVESRECLHDSELQVAPRAENLHIAICDIASSSLDRASDGLVQAATS